MAATAIREALARAPGLDPAEVDDVILGCAMPEAEQGLNVARIASLRAGVPVSASALTVNRFCSSGLQSIAHGAERIMAGFAERRRRGRNRVDEPRADGRTQGRAESGAGRHLPGRLPDDGSRRREPRARSRRHRARNRTRSRSPATRRPSPRSTPAGSRTRSCRSRFVVASARRDRRRCVRRRRRAAARHVARGAREVEAGVSRQRHGHGRQLVADERRRRSGRRDVRRSRALRSALRRSHGSSRLRPLVSNPSASASVRCRRSERS